MLVAIDYDFTITCDEVAWHDCVEILASRGHRVIIVSLRYERPKDLSHLFEDYEFYCTSRMAKEKFLAGLGLDPDVWIDDQPKYILEDHRSRSVPS